MKVVNETASLPLALTINFPINDVRRAAAMCGLEDVSDENLKRMFFNRDKPLPADLKSFMTDGYFEFCTAMVGIMIGLIAQDENNEALIDEVTRNNVLNINK